MRKITSYDILDAAERVVGRLGATRLSIDAVAKEADVSKSRVVYDHKSKNALIEALIDRRIQLDKERLEKAIKRNADTPHPELWGRIDIVAHAPDEVEKAVAFAICVSMSSEENIQQQMRDLTQEDLRAMADSSRPKAALMAYLALAGFMSIEYANVHEWSKAERQEILEGIRTIFTSFPGK